MLHLNLSLRHPLTEVASVLDLSELHRKQCGMLFLKSEVVDFPPSNLDRAKGILPECFLDCQMQGLYTALARLHILVPQGQDVAQFKTVVILVDSVHYRLERSRVLHLKHLRLAVFFLNLSLEVVSLKVMLMKILFNLTFNILNNSFFIVQI